MTFTINHLINNEIKQGASDRFADIFNPATGEVAGKVALANKTDVDQAVSAARKAFATWSEVTPLRRARVMFNYKALLEAHKEELAKLVTREHGKTLSDAIGSVQRGIEVVEYACGIPNLLKGTYSEQVGTGVDSYDIRQPIGVCVGITPFNFPAMVPLWMFPLAVACGNTFILKPSEKTPSCALRLGELFSEAGGPAGVLNIINGDKEAVDVLLHHPDVAAVSFVGSTPVARAIYQTASAQGKRVQALGGAKNHAVVMPDADMDRTVDAIIGAAYGSAGERCMAISVVVAVGDVIADQLVERLRPLVAELKIGDGFDKDVEMGPLVTAEHRERVLSYVEAGVEEGATLVVDGRRFNSDKGFFTGGYLFDHVQPTMKIYQEEIFGPVLSIVRVEDFQQALTLVNNNAFGNGTAIFTKQGKVAREFAKGVKVGMVGINIPIPVPVAFHSFGGWKQSLFGSMHIHGPEGIRFYTYLKTITQRWPEMDASTPEFVMPTLK